MAADPPPLPEESSPAAAWAGPWANVGPPPGRHGAAETTLSERRIGVGAGFDPSGATPLEVSWRGSPWRLVGLSLINALLVVATLGIYSFWGKTEVRRRIWSSVRLNGEPMRYTGTGRELMLGFLVVFAVVLLPVLLITLAAMVMFGPESGVPSVVQTVLYGIFFFLVGVAAYRARRYRLSRTTWRGIRGTMTGSSLLYAVASFFTVLLYPLTLGWIAPWRANMLQRRLTQETALGNRRLAFDGTSGPLYARYTIVWVGTLLIIAIAVLAVMWLLGPKLHAIVEGAIGIGPRQMLSLREITGVAGIALGAFCLWSIISAWYRAGMANHFARSTTYEGARFELAVGPGGLIWLFIGNLLLIVLSIGILKPVAEARAARYFVERLRLEGAIDLAEIAQSDAALGGTGEGLAQAFDVDAF